MTTQATGQEPEAVWTGHLFGLEVATQMMKEVVRICESLVLADEADPDGATVVFTALNEPTALVAVDWCSFRWVKCTTVVGNHGPMLVDEVKQPFKVATWCVRSDTKPTNAIGQVVHQFQVNLHRTRRRTFASIPRPRRQRLGRWTRERTCLVSLYLIDNARCKGYRLAWTTGKVLDREGWALDLMVGREMVAVDRNRAVGR